MSSNKSNSFHQILGVGTYVKQRGVGTVAVLTSFTILLGVILWAVQSNALTSIVDWVGIVAGIMTLAVVWFLDRRREWIESIEKQATFTYWYWSNDDWTRWKTIEEVFLAAESDIRNWSQSLGGQLKAGDTMLPLDAYVHVSDWNPAPVRTPTGGWVRRFDVHTPLWMDPDDYTREMPFKSALYEERPEGSDIWVPKKDEFRKLLASINGYSRDNATTQASDA